MKSQFVNYPGWDAVIPAHRNTLPIITLKTNDRAEEYQAGREGPDTQHHSSCRQLSAFETLIEDGLPFFCLSLCELTGP